MGFCPPPLDFFNDFIHNDRIGVIGVILGDGSAKVPDASLLLMGGCKMKTTATVVAIMLAASVNIAHAGEVDGRGEPVEIKGKSLCAYSGLEDGEGAGPGDVQTFGRHPAADNGNGTGVSDNPEMYAPRGRAAPGMACSPGGSEPS